MRMFNKTRGLYIYIYIYVHIYIYAHKHKMLGGLWDVVSVLLTGRVSLLKVLLTMTTILTRFPNQLSVVPKSHEHSSMEALPWPSL